MSGGSLIKARYFDKQGRSISFDDWSALLKDKKYEEIATKHIKDSKIVCRWSGAHVTKAFEKPMIFYVKVIGGPISGYLLFSSDEESALKDFDKAVRKVILEYER